MDDLKYFVMTNKWATRSNPDAIMRTYRTGQQVHEEVYDFFKPGWDDTDFFQDYRRGHIDNDYEEVPEAEAEQQIQDKLRRKAEREQKA